MLITKRYFSKHFQGDTSTALATSANWLGLAYVGQLLFTGELHRFRFRWQKLDTLLLIFLIVLLFTALIRVDFDVSLKELKRYPSFIGFYFITRVSMSSMNRIREMLSVFYATLLIVFIITIQKSIIGSQYGALTDFIFLLSPVLHLKLKEIKRISLKEIMPVLILAVGSLSLLISDSRRVLMSVALIWLSAFSAKRFTTLFFIVIIPLVFLLQGTDVGVEFRYQQSADQLLGIIKKRGGRKCSASIDFRKKSTLGSGIQPYRRLSFFWSWFKQSHRIIAQLWCLCEYPDPQYISGCDCPDRIIWTLCFLFNFNSFIDKIKTHEKNLKGTWPVITCNFS